MASVKLKSSDGVIFTVDAATVKQMGMIQAMIERWNSEKVVQLHYVKAQVLEKIIQWTDYHEVDREKTEKIAWYIQYFNVDLNELFKIIIAADYLEVKSLLKESCRNVLINYDWKIIEGEPAEVLTPLIHYKEENGYEVIVTKVDDKYLKYFDTKTEKWAHLTDIPEEHSRDYYKVCCVEGNIYLVGGRYGDRVTEYNPCTNTWRNMPSLQRGRVGPSVCTLDNKIFVLGGNGGRYGDGTICEMLDLSDDDPHWRYIAQMNNGHGRGGAVVMERKIYVLGGGTRNVEVYDVNQDLWRTMSSVDCYDPNTNTWSQMANMNIARWSHSLVSLQGRLYAIGGADVDSVEVYDPDNNTWTLLKHKLDGEVYNTGAGLIKKYYLNK